MRDDDDDNGQVDGDTSSPLTFATSMKAAPWLREGIPPWHMWGTSETVTLIGDTVAIPAVFPGVSQQLSKVAYKRPDTWQWLFFARIINGPTDPINQAAVDFDVTIGLGRSSVTLRSFESFRWTWLNAPVSPDLRWSTSGIQPSRDGIVAADHSVSQLVASDIQVQARLAGATSAGVARQFVIEVASFFAPRTHTRPDWLLIDVPLEQQFQGSETGGK